MISPARIPSGSLGRRLLVRVEDIMRRGEELPRVAPEALLSEGLLEMTRKGLGMTAVLDAQGQLLGVFTDGDLRRALDRKVDVHSATMSQVMTRGGRSIDAHELATAAAQADAELPRNGAAGHRPAAALDRGAQHS